MLDICTVVYFMYGFSGYSSFYSSTKTFILTFFNFIIKKNDGICEEHWICFYFRAFVDQINTIHFQGVSGYISFNGSDRASDIFIKQFFLNETKTIAKYVPMSTEESGSWKIDEKNITWLTADGWRPTDGNPGIYHSVNNYVQDGLHQSCGLVSPWYLGGCRFTSCGLNKQKW